MEVADLMRLEEIKFEGLALIYLGGSKDFEPTSLRCSLYGPGLFDSSRKVSDLWEVIEEEGFSVEDVEAVSPAFTDGSAKSLKLG